MQGTIVMQTKSSTEPEERTLHMRVDRLDRRVSRLACEEKV